VNESSVTSGSLPRLEAYCFWSLAYSSLSNSSPDALYEPTLSFNSSKYSASAEFLLQEEEDMSA
jgi:hypothetical protein